jgi:hypothetical protein
MTKDELDGIAQRILSKDFSYSEMREFSKKIFGFQMAADFSGTHPGVRESVE